MAKEHEKTDSLRNITDRLISVSEACEISGFTPSYIRRLLRNSTIEGVKLGRDWYLTEDAIRDYLEKERRPGPKTD